jgi:hypothetical protein
MQYGRLILGMLNIMPMGTEPRQQTKLKHMDKHLPYSLLLAMLTEQKILLQ